MRLAVALVLVARIAHADDLEVPGRDSTELRGDAMVVDNAPFYFEPWEGGQAMVYGYGRTHNASASIPVRIVAASLRDFVEVELVQQDTCSQARLAPDPRIDGVRLFVKRRDLVPVLVKPFAITFANGTSARLSPGVPVLPLDGDRYQVAARGDVIELPIPHSSVGYTYTRGAAAEPPLPSGALWRLERVMPVKLGDADFEARTGWLATRSDERGERVKLRWATRCIELVVEVPAKSLRKASRPVADLHAQAAAPPAPTGQTIPPGTPLATLHGHGVAVATSAIDVLPPTGDTACFDARFVFWFLDQRPWSQYPRTVRLCAPASAVEVTAPAP